MPTKSSTALDACLALVIAYASNASDVTFFSPSSSVAVADMANVGCASSKSVLCLDAAKRKVTGAISVDGSPTGLALSRSGTELYVTCRRAWEQSLHR